MKPRALIARLLIASWAALSWAGCAGEERRGFIGNSGPTVGGPCIETVDCSSGSFCVLEDDDGHFPGGTCTLPCDDHGDCPGTTACVDLENGICLLECDRDQDCRGEYDCAEQADRGGDGESLVCVK